MKVIIFAFLVVASHAGLAGVSSREYRPTHSVTTKRCGLLASADGTEILVLTENQFLALDAAGLAVKRTVGLENSYVKLAERPDHYVAATHGALHLLSKKTLRPLRTIRLPGSGVSDLALHPRQRLCYVAIHDNEGGRLSKLAAMKVAWVDEQRGQVKFLPRVLGQWVAVHPSGRYLYTALHEMYRAGYRLDWHVGAVLPDYGNIDVLISYEIVRGGVRHRHTNATPGANGRKLRVSPDGAHVSYVSGGGYRSGAPRLRGYTVPAFAGDDIRSAQTAYHVGSYPTDVCFHPVLDLVAGTNGGSVKLFDRKSGRALADKVDLGDRKLGKIRQVFFTPDGKRLLVDSNDQSKRRALRSFALRLTDKEKQQLEKVPRRRPATTLVAADPPASARPEPKVAIPIADLEGLGKAGAAKMDTRQIARTYIDSVVVIRGGQGGGSGFVIGSKGYILTCAHVIPPIGDPVVHYRTRVGDRVVTRSARAQVLGTDKEQDLALLRITTTRPLPVARLDSAAKLEIGESVSLIGHPGLGRETLDYTMTQGIISNGARVIDRQPYIQTTAAVNPGCSGAPLFNSRGNVIGLVVLKARIEATGFAIPATRLERFVCTHTRGTASPGGTAAAWAPSTPPSTGRFRVDTPRKAGIEWVKASNVFGPRHKLVSQMSSIISAQTAAGKGLVLTFGSGLMKAGKPAMLGVWHGEIFAQHLSRTMAREMNIGKAGICAQRSSVKHGRRLANPVLAISTIVADAPTRITLTGKISGTVNYRRLRDQKGHYALRLHCLAGDKTVVRIHRLGETIPRLHGAFNFTFDSLASGGARQKGPLMLFMDLVTYLTPERADDPISASNTVATVVNVLPAR